MRKYFAVSIIAMVLLMSMSACSSTPKKLSGEEIYSKIVPSTVEIYAESAFTAGQGSGFFIDDKGTVVTNCHVIEDCSCAYVTTSDGDTYEVTSVLGYSEELDIAILKTDVPRSVAAERNSAVTTGETVYVLGSSRGLTGTFSEGLVSTAERIIGEVPYIQISAPISPGNSGGPVVNAYGEVIGIATLTRTDGQNLNFALPVSLLVKISLDHPMTMHEFYEATSEYVHLGDRVMVNGSMLAVRTITLDKFMAEYIVALWERGEASETTMIQFMDEYGSSQGGGVLRIIDPGVYIEEVDSWCFDPSRKPGDYSIIKNPYGYTICYISFLQP